MEKSFYATQYAEYICQLVFFCILVIDSYTFIDVFGISELVWKNCIFYHNKL